MLSEIFPIALEFVSGVQSLPGVRILQQKAGEVGGDAQVWGLEDPGVDEVKPELHLPYQRVVQPRGSQDTLKDSHMCPRRDSPQLEAGCMEGFHGPSVEGREAATSSSDHDSGPAT